MAITANNGINALVAAIATAQAFTSSQASMTATAAGTLQSLWTAAGFPVAGAAPTTAAGAIVDRTTVGAVPFAAIAGGLTAYFSKFATVFATAGTLHIADRLWASAALNGTLITAQAINSPTITRGPTSPNQLYLEFYTATGNTAANATISYTNQSGVAGRTATVAMPGNPVVGQLTLVTLQTGDTGVQSVQSLTLSASTGTAGNFGLTILSLIDLTGTSSPNVGVPRGVYDTGLPVLDPSACLMFYVQPTATNTGQITAMIQIASG